MSIILHSDGLLGKMTGTVYEEQVKFINPKNDGHAKQANTGVDPI